MDAPQPTIFSAPLALAFIDALDDAGLDRLDIGVIGFDHQCLVQRYNARESRFSGLPTAQVLGTHLFTQLAQCMNNYLVAQRFQDAQDAGVPLDETLDYVLTWRMRPTRVQLRLLGAPQSRLRYVLLRHAG
jgi:photoactive yellow protein